MTRHHADMTDFFARQTLGFLTPANWLPTNPVVLHENAKAYGGPLMRGIGNWLEGLVHRPGAAAAGSDAHFKVGRDVAVTPGKVVLRNRLVELIRYDAQTKTVHPEPLFIVPSWINKFYILDLSPHNSMVRYLVEQGHGVHAVVAQPRRRRPRATMDDYLQLGIFDALARIGELGGPGRRPAHRGLAAWRHAGSDRRCRDRRAAHRRPPGRGCLLATITLLAAQTDFSEPGELGLFIDESQVAYLRDHAREGLSHRRADGRVVPVPALARPDLDAAHAREYLMGEREQPSDLMAWNTDTTRMPARMHNEYLTALYLHNALATAATASAAAAAASSRSPTCASRCSSSARRATTYRRGIRSTSCTCSPAPRSRLTLASGGHNAGIVSRARTRATQLLRSRPAPSRAGGSSPATTSATRHVDGSWWPAWQEWLAAHSTARWAPPALPPRASLGDAPGEIRAQVLRQLQVRHRGQGPAPAVQRSAVPEMLRGRHWGQPPPGDLSARLLACAHLNPRRCCSNCTAIPTG